MGENRKRPSKVKDLLKRVRLELEQGSYLYASHANKRLQQREVTRLEVKQVLKSGYHEKRKDSFNESFDTWNYSIRGKTIDSRELRVAISFDEDGMLIITVIDLSK